MPELKAREPVFLPCVMAVCWVAVGKEISPALPPSAHPASHILMYSAPSHFWMLHLVILSTAEASAYFRQLSVFLSYLQFSGEGIVFLE